MEKWLLATSDYGNEIKEDLSATVGYDEKFNNAIVRHSLYLKDEAIFRYPNLVNVTFHDMKKFDLVNLVIGELASQVRASKLTDYELTKKLLEQGEIDKLQLSLDALKYGINNDDNENGGTGRGGDVGGNDADDGTPGPDLLRKTSKQEMDEIVRRLNYLRRITPDVSPDNTSEKNYRIIARQNQDRFQNRQIKEREREIKNIPKGIINKRKSNLNLNFPDTPLYTPPQNNFSRYLQSPTSTPI